MIEATRIRYLRIALVAVGLIFVVGVYPLTIVWPYGWAWHTGQSEYLQMILVLYATLGVFHLGFPQPSGASKLDLHLRFRPVSPTEESWLFEPVVNPRHLAIFGETCWRCSSWRPLSPF